ncbi:hypothetical protein GHYDROH2_07240 [Geobacter hydrogenophilus]|uniref:Uncharacterized protein n=1 Tax=Geobacter hydrogenophilus TaxID=40983 RepID=A0A9W6FYQ5_9BACT|nr:hypothetical protein GHYDROH2_07240 [Geobacter hydrogenophilus]
MLRVAGNPHGPAVLHLHQEAAGVGAVVGADGASHFGGHGYLVDGEWNFKGYTPLTPAPLPQGEGVNQTLSLGERVAKGRVRGDKEAASMYHRDCNR